MNIDEFRDIDKDLAYVDWLEVSEAKESGLIPAKFHEFFDDECECGSVNIINRNLKTMMCCDPNCCIKQGYALAMLFSRFGIKGLQEATCTKILKSMREKDEYEKKLGKPGILVNDSYVAVLAVPWEKYPIDVSSSAKGVDFYKACVYVTNQAITFPKLVAKLAIPTLDNGAEQLFDGFANFEEAFEEIKRIGNLHLFCEYRGFHARTVAHHLRNNLITIATADSIFSKNMRIDSGIKIHVCMTGAITHEGVKTTKDRYIKKCNDLCCIDNMQIIETVMNSAKGTNPFILYSRPSADAKYMMGQQRGTIVDEFGQHEVLMHTDTYYSFLEKVVQKWNQITKNSETGSQPQMTMQQLMQQMMQETLHPELCSQKISNSKEQTTSEEMISEESQQMKTSKAF